MIATGNRLLAIAQAALLTAVILLLLAACNSNASNGNSAEEEEEITAIPVEAAEVHLGNVTAAYEGTTTLEPDEQATVVAKTTGVALSFSVEEGDFVEKGTVLAQLEQDRYQLELQRAAAELNRLQKEYDRNSSLFKRDLVSTDEYDRTRYELDSQTAAHALAKLNLDYTTIRAPITGYVSERMVKVGNLITEHQPVFRIDSFDPLLAVLHVPEREIGILRRNQEVTLRLDAYPGEIFTGEVIRISPVIDVQTGTFRVTAKVHDPNSRLKSGLFGRVNVVYETRDQVPVVSRDAVISEDGINHVFVVGEDSKVVRREIALGFGDDHVVQVINGLEIGEQVVTSGKGSLREGSEVEVISRPTASLADS